MIPWVRLGTAAIPGGTEELRLWQRGAEFSIRLGTVELMNSRRGNSEAALAVRACQHLPDRPRLLIGGLGLGFTLRAALDALDRDGEVVVAEIVPAVAAWARGPLADLFAGSLDDPRVRLVVGDVGDLIRAGAANYDAILLDVDNGPAGQVRAANGALYGRNGPCRGRRARCTPQGSSRGMVGARPTPPSPPPCAEAGFVVAGPSPTGSQAPAGRGGRHVIWLGRRRRSPPACGTSRGMTRADANPLAPRRIGSVDGVPLSAATQPSAKA